VKWLRGGLVFKAHRLLYYSTLGLRVIKKKKKESWTRMQVVAGDKLVVYGGMGESKYNPKPDTRKPKPENQNPKPENPKPQTRNSKLGIPHPET